MQVHKSPGEIGLTPSPVKTMPARIERRGRKRLTPPEAIWGRLGKQADSILAAEFGISVTRVRRLRVALGIPHVPANGRPKIVLAADQIQMLGTMPDRCVAELLNVARDTVAGWRATHGVPAFGRPPRSRMLRENCSRGAT